MEKPQYGQTLQFEEIAPPVIFQTPKSQIRIASTKNHGIVLFMDNEVQLSSMDEHRYHEMLVHPVMADVTESLPMKRLRVLILGGGDGCAAREVFKWPNIDSVTVVDYDSDFVQFAAKDSVFSDLNQRVFERENLYYISTDARDFVENCSTVFDVILIDLPDPSDAEFIELYIWLIRAIRHLLAEHGGVACHVGPVGLNPLHENWRTIQTLKETLRQTFEKETSLDTVYVPSFSNEWGILRICDAGSDEVNATVQSVQKQCRYWRRMMTSWTPDILENYFLW